MLRLTLAICLAVTLCGCATTGPSVSGTVRTPDVIYSEPGRK